MAMYRPRPDGLLEVVQDDGSVSPGLPPTIQGDLEAQGILAQQPPQELGLAEAGATASLPLYAGEPLQAPKADPRAQLDGVALPWDTGGAAGGPVMASAPAPTQRDDYQRGALQLAGRADPSTLVGGGEGGGAPRMGAPDPREQTMREVDAEMARGTYVAPRPERDVLVGFTEQGRAPLPEEELKKRQKNWAAQVTETRKQGQLAGERADREQLAQYVGLQQQAQQVERDRDVQAMRETTAAQLKAEADKAKAEIQSVDPKAYWNEMGGEERFFAIMSVALMGFAAGFTGSGRNPALEMMQQAISENIDAQKAKIGQQEARYSEATAAYERAREAAGGDERTADLIYEIGMSRVFADQARLYAEQVGSDELRSQAEQMALQMEEQIAEKETELAGLNRVRAAQFAHQEARAGGVVHKSYDEAVATVAKRHEMEEKAGLRDPAPGPEDMKRMIVLPGGQRVYAPAEGDRPVLREKIQNAGKMLAAIDTQLKIIDTPGKSLSPEQRALANANARVLGGYARSLLVGQGAVSDSERPIIEQAVAQDAAGVFSFDTTNKAALSILRKASEQDQRDAYDQLSTSPTTWQPLTPPDQVRGVGKAGW